jgi:hypothetical protein
MKPARPAGFFASRWRGQVPLSTLLWRDMVFVGSLLNLAASVLALILAAHGLPLGWAVAVHFAPLPYSAFLFAALWRMPRRGMVHSVIGVTWLATMAVV